MEFSDDDIRDHLILCTKDDPAWRKAFFDAHPYGFNNTAKWGSFGYDSELGTYGIGSTFNSTEALWSFTKQDGFIKQIRVDIDDTPEFVFKLSDDAFYENTFDSQNDQWLLELFFRFPDGVETFEWKMEPGEDDTFTIRSKKVEDRWCTLALRHGQVFLVDWPEDEEQDDE